DEVIMPIPSFSQYAFGAAVMGARVVKVPLRKDFSYDVEALAAAVTDRTKLVYVCSPNNPTGTILTAEEASWLLSHTPDHVVVIFDLAYNDYSDRADRVMETPELLNDPRVVCIHTFSKLYGLAGLRVGFGIAHADFWRYVHCVREPFNVNRVAQRAAVAALSDEPHRQASRALAATSRKQYAAFSERTGVWLPPAEGNFILVDVGDGRRATEALMAQGIMVRQGFGLDGHVRITFGTEEENEICIDALQAWLATR
ncbi:MAG: aminotransferase class I/II-fold pyridoxal phosphate-dependent enzyme, partial [Alicyclobacillus sp.]|nr:aminotransferase class I/II-fold pyridoxal phosphate-dependent enzyme [Alicyclobacillus sp.]